MRKAKVYFLNGLTVSFVGLVLRFAAMAYTVYVSGKLGAEGMGLLSLVSSVHTLALTLASSGVNLTCTRLCADALALENYRETRRSLKGCILYSLFFGLFAAVLLYSLSGFLGNSVLKDPRTVVCLRALCPVLPVSALTACFSGYMNACRRAFKGSLVSIFETGLKILLTAFFFSLLLSKGQGVEAVTYSAALSETVAFLLLCLILMADTRKNLPKSGKALPRLSKRLLGISLPLAAAAWVRSALVTAEHILIPRGLREYGVEKALGTYGIMHGMALPVIFFPYAILTPFTSLLMPEIARFKAEKKEKNISFCTALTLRLTLLFAFGCSALFVLFGEELGFALYKTEGVGHMISLFALLIPVMYADTATDSVLKGLGEQVYCMKVNIADAAISLLLVIFLVPRMGAYGYLITVFLSECFNTFFSVQKLRKRTGFTLSFLRSVLLPGACAFLSASLVKLLWNFLKGERFGFWLLFPALVLFLLLYLPLLSLTKALFPQDKRYFKRLFKGK